MKPLLIANNLHSHEYTRLVVNAPHDLTETSLAKYVDDFIPVRKMISRYDSVVSTFVVVTKVGGIGLKIAHHLASVLRAAKVDVVIVNDFTTLIDVEHSDPNSFLGTNSFLWRRTFP